MTFYSCSTVPQIQIPEVNPNYATKGYVDTSVQVKALGLLQDINFLKTQNTQYKKIIDSLKNVIIVYTIKVDTTAASDFNVKNGVMTFNKTNLNKMIKTEVIRNLPTKISTKKNKK